MIALRPAQPQRHPFRLALFGALPRELHDPAIWVRAAIGFPIVATLLLAALVVTP